MNEITLTAGDQSFNTYDDAAGMMPGINTFTTHTGAGRFGIGRFLMVASDYFLLEDAAGSSGVVSVVMTCGSESLTLNLVLVGSLKHSAAVASASDSVTFLGFADDMVEAILFDKRSLRVLGVNKAYNVQDDTLSTDQDDSVAFFSTTLSSNSEWNWSGALSDTSVYDGTSVPDTPNWNPRNLVFDGLPQSRTLDAIAAQLGWIVGFDYATDKYTLWTPDQRDSANDAAIDLNLMLSGGSTARSASRLPSAFDVRFPSRDTDNTIDPYEHHAYIKRVSTGGGNPSIIQTLQVGNYVALRKDGAWYQQSVLDDVAADLAARTFAQMSAPIGEYELPGLRSVRLDGRVRGIKWISDHQGARTIVRFNDDRDFNPMQDFQRQTEAISNTLLVGGGSTLVGLSPGGTRLVWGGGGTAGTLPTGQYPGMVLQVGANNQDVFGWIEAHEVI